MKSKNTEKNSEVFIAGKMVESLKADGWEVYQEVDSCDIVAVKGKIIWAIEAKRILNEDVIFQAQRWAAHANMVSVVVEGCGYGLNGFSRIKRYYMQQHGIGLFNVRTETSGCYVYSKERDPDGDGANTREWTETRTTIVEQLMQPKLIRRRTDRIEKVLCEEMKTHLAAGSPGNSGWTPFKTTCKLLLEYVKANGEGVTLKQGIDAIKTHYKTGSSAVGSMKKNIESGFVPGLRLDNGKLYFTEKKEEAV